MTARRKGQRPAEGDAGAAPQEASSAAAAAATVATAAEAAGGGGGSAGGGGEAEAPEDGDGDTSGGCKSAAPPAPANLRRSAGPSAAPLGLLTPSGECTTLPNPDGTHGGSELGGAGGRAEAPSSGGGLGAFGDGGLGPSSRPTRQAESFGRSCQSKAAAEVTDSDTTARPARNRRPRPKPPTWPLQLRGSAGEAMAQRIWRA
mmetsp:Transcript_22054/g.61707  ORF Transcript_22054/g.61707 Transcript_22054/m.61707 type:complete len:203 (-) Transcript_22054:33-641(-)